MFGENTWYIVIAIIVVLVIYYATKDNKLDLVEGYGGGGGRGGGGRGGGGRGGSVGRGGGSRSSSVGRGSRSGSVGRSNGANVTRSRSNSIGANRSRSNSLSRPRSNSFNVSRRSGGDRNHNGIPDRLENRNFNGVNRDRNHNGVPDRFERRYNRFGRDQFYRNGYGGYGDWNGDGIPDIFNYGGVYDVPGYVYDYDLNDNGIRDDLEYPYLNNELIYNVIDDDAQYLYNNRYGGALYNDIQTFVDKYGGGINRDEVVRCVSNCLSNDPTVAEFYNCINVCLNRSPVTIPTWVR